MERICVFWICKDIAKLKYPLIEGERVRQQQSSFLRILLELILSMNLRILTEDVAPVTTHNGLTLKINLSKYEGSKVVLG